MRHFILIAAVAAFIPFSAYAEQPVEVSDAQPPPQSQLEEKANQTEKQTSTPKVNPKLFTIWDRLTTAHGDKFEPSPAGKKLLNKGGTATGNFFNYLRLCQGAPQENTRTCKFLTQGMDNGSLLSPSPANFMVKGLNQQATAGQPNNQKEAKTLIQKWQTQLELEEAEELDYQFFQAVFYQRIKDCSLQPCEVVTKKEQQLIKSSARFLKKVEETPLQTNAERLANAF